MARGPHDEEIEKREPERDHARERRDEFLRQRGIPVPGPEGESNQEDEPDRPDKKNPNDKKNPKKKNPKKQ